ncbi:MAG TPA: hydroxyacylglutathione hydrolase [Pseudomonadales bacterium]
MSSIHPIAAFNDNYIWAFVHNDRIIVVDPGDAAPVEQFIRQQQLPLSAILITHWHADHTGGLAQLAGPGVAVYAPEHPAITPVTHIVKNGEQLDIDGLLFDVIAVPGHTLEHVAYHCPARQLLFCGDTLFAAGCGRLFEGSAQQMLDSLNSLASLPGATRVYCAHEYTLANLQFARAVEPDNTAIWQREAHCRQLRQAGEPSLPSSIAEELASNPFLRVTEPAVINSALSHGAASNRPVDVFYSLREWKNQF